MTDLGRRIFGLAAIAFGLIGLNYADFATVWQPVPEELPARSIFAVATALLFLGSGLALQWQKTVRLGAAALAAIYFVFAVLWARRIVGYPQIFATWSGTAEQIALVVAAVSLFARFSTEHDLKQVRVIEICRVIFGICAIAFGVNHFFNMTETAGMVPAWLPPNQWTWAFVTGLAAVLAGVAIASGVMALLAARLLAAMFIVFSLLIWLPGLFSAPENQVVWGGNAMNLALIGAAWVMADFIHSSEKIRHSPPMHTSAFTTTDV